MGVCCGCLGYVCVCKCVWLYRYVWFHYAYTQYHHAPSSSHHHHHHGHQCGWPHPYATQPPCCICVYHKGYMVVAPVGVLPTCSVAGWGVMHHTTPVCTHHTSHTRCSGAIVPHNPPLLLPLWVGWVGFMDVRSPHSTTFVLFLLFCCVFFLYVFLCVCFFLRFLVCVFFLRFLVCFLV